MANYILTKVDLDPSGQFSGSIENDTIEIEDINDTVSYRILGLSGEDSIFGAQGKDVLFGMDGNDIVYGLSEDDIIYGNEGNDTLQGDLGNDILYGGQGNDFLTAGGTFNADDKGSFLYGNLGDDTIIGSSSDSFKYPFGLFGGQGKDSLRGGSGDDTISGDRGQDILAGGGGNDTLIIGKTANASEIPTGTENTDLILDFINGEDKIGLVGVTFEQLLISEIQPPQVDAIFGAGSLENNNVNTKLLKIEAGGELLAIVGRDRDNFTLTASDFIII